LSPAAITIKSFAVATNTAFEEDQLATADSTGEIYLWSLRSGSLVKTFVGLQKGAQALSFSADGTKLIGSAQFEAITWDIASGKSLTWKIEDENADRRFVVASAMNSPKSLLALGRNDGYVDIWNVKTHAFLGRIGDLDPGAVGSNTGPGFISKVVFSNSGDLVAFQKQGGALDVWDYKLHIRKLQKRCGGSALTFSTDDHLLACAIASQGMIWDLDSGKLEELKTEEQRLSSIEFSNDGTEIFGGAFNAIVVWDVKSGEVKKVLRDSSSPMGLKTIGTTSLVSINEDSTIGVFGTQHAVLLAKGVTLSRDNWISFTPDGFFDGTAQAWKELAFHSDLNPLTLFDLERFFSQFYQPGLLSSVIEEGRPVREVLASRNDPRALIEIGPLKTSHLPIVRSASPSSAQLEITTRQIPIALDAEDTGSGVRDCRVFRNGILVFRDRRALANEGAHLSLSFDLTVVAGKNAVKAYCFNSDQLKSKDFTFLLTGSQSLYRKGKAYIFSIGIDDYSSSPLHYAKADAVAIAGKLSSSLSTTARYDVQTPIVLRDSSATKKNITWALRAFAGDQSQGEAPLPELRSAALLQPEDSLIIYFAGHGFAKGEHYYLVPHDYLQTISEEDLQSALEPIDVSHLGLIIDSCQSGSLLSPEVRTGPLNSGGLAQLAYEKGAYILVASQSDQPAREFDSLKHGLLTSVLINNAFSTLSDGLPQNSYIYMGDWLSAAVREVPIVHSHLYESDATRSEKVSFGQPLEAGSPAHYWYQVPGLYFRREGEELAFPIARTHQ
jgi:WD40 repeat protein